MNLPTLQSPETNNCYVYALIHIEARNVFYIGRGTHDNNRKGNKYFRYYRHFWEARNGSKLPVHCKIRSLLEKEQTIEFELCADNVSLEKAMETEKKLISSYGLDNLMNLSPGGDDLAWIQGNVKDAIKQPRKERTPEWIENHRKSSKKKPVRLTHSKSGELLDFDSLHSAARHLGVDTNAIWQAVSGKVNTTKGYIATYIIPQEKKYCTMATAKVLKGLEGFGVL